MTDHDRWIERPDLGSDAAAARPDALPRIGEASTDRRARKLAHGLAAASGGNRCLAGQRHIGGERATTVLEETERIVSRTVPGRSSRF